MDVGVGCMRYFGIRSYLDNFYDRQGECERHDKVEHRYLIPSHRPKFSSRWWKIALWLGTILVTCGFFLLMISFMIPRKNIQADTSSSSPVNAHDQVMLIDREAIKFNEKLYNSHIVGICLVISGGILFALALLLPTFCHMWCASGDSNDETDPFKFKMETTGTEQIFPGRSVSKIIQPTHHKDESRITTEGMMPISAVQ